jgi:hypothetical protein
MICCQKTLFFQYKDAEWMQDILNRAALEQIHNVSTPEGSQFWTDAETTGDYPFPWFPSPLKNCFSGFQQRDNSCRVLIDNWEEQYILSINTTAGDHTYFATLDDIDTVLSDVATFSDHSTALLNDSYANGMQDVTNPEVPMVLIYGSHLNTEYVVDYEYDPTIITDTNNFAWPTSETQSGGDGTVLTTSMLLPGLKWAWEFEHKDTVTDSSPKPIKIMEWCSTYNTKNWIYDTVYPDQTNQILKNEYIGVNCSCQVTSGSTTGSNCVHANIMDDPNVIQILASVVKTNTYGVKVENTYAGRYSSANLTTLVNICPMLTYNRTIQNVDDLFSFRVTS